MNRVLEDHGTTAFMLKPSSIVGAAIEDVRRFFRNKERGELGYAEYEQYAFAREHVRRACSKGIGAKDLIALAIDEPGIGRLSGKRSTRLIYSDTELLKRALDEFASHTKSEHQNIGAFETREATTG